jgi:hypothetical protein
LPSWFGVGHCAISQAIANGLCLQLRLRSAPLRAAHFAASIDELIPKLIDGVLGYGEPSLAVNQRPAAGSPVMIGISDTPSGTISGAGLHLDTWRSFL